MSAPTSTPHDLAEAAAAQLVLDRLQQVVGLVGDREVGVAGDAEDVVVDDLHAREQRVEVVGDHVLERDERVGRRRSATKRGSISFGTFTRANVSAPVDRVAHEHARGDSDRLEMYGNGRPRPTASGVSTGKIWRRKRSSSAAALGLVERRRRRRCGCRARPAPGAARRSKQRLWRSLLLARRARGSRRSSRAACRPSGSRASRCPASIWSCRPATRTMKNSSRFEREDRAELHALEQRHARVLGELQHAVVEVEPRELAVEVERVGRSRSGGLVRGLRACVGFGAGVGHRDDCAGSATST